MPRLHAHFLPHLVEPSSLAGSTCVVIDVLRATTTIVHALAAGAKEVIPCLEVDEALKAAASYAFGEVVLGGERGGRRIESFQLGNSPAEYDAAAVGGKTVVFTTTNGTRAMQHCRSAERVLLGAFVNLKVLCQSLLNHERIELICAGTDGQITREDVLLAGAIVHVVLQNTSWELWDVNDEALIAQNTWSEAVVSKPTGKLNLAAASALLANVLRKSRGGSNLIELGMAADIDRAAKIDKFSLVPRLDLAAWRIT